MKKILPIIIGILVLVAGFIVWQKSQVATKDTRSKIQDASVKKVDLSTQPDWVQKLQVSAKKGVSGNGLENFTLTVTGIPTGMVSTVSYVVQYQTTNKGTQGALSSTPITVNGTSFTRTIDLGTCSTKSCVRHEGVTSVDIELDFVTSDGSKATWEKTLDLK